MSDAERLDPLQLLFNPAFQDWLVNFPRPRTAVVVAHTVRDEVGSEGPIRVGSGRESRPGITWRPEPAPSAMSGWAGRGVKGAGDWGQQPPDRHTHPPMERQGDISVPRDRVDRQ